MRTHQQTHAGRAGPLALALMLGAFAATAHAQEADLEAPPAPTENPVTEAKRVLGKILSRDVRAGVR